MEEEEDHGLDSLGESKQECQQTSKKSPTANKNASRKVKNDGVVSGLADSFVSRIGSGKGTVGSWA